MFIRTLCVDYDKEKPVLVVIHGYGSSAALLYKIHGRLAKRFRVYLID